MKKEAEELIKKTNYTFEDLCAIMRLLRSEGGCPWDREQTHESIRKNLIEETYEVVEAIDNRDAALMREELGDLMLQVVFHARISEEEGRFDIGDVCDEICRKLIVRHPHIFGDVSAETSDQVLDNWDAIKRSTKKQKSSTQAMESVSKALPSLMRAYKLGEKAAKTGFDFSCPAQASDGVREELDELNEAMALGKIEETQEELGDLLFAVVNLARKLKIDPEEALYRASDKFVARFAHMESAASAAGKMLSDYDPDALEELWEDAKDKKKRIYNTKKELYSPSLRQKMQKNY